MASGAKSWDAADYATHAAFVPALGNAVLELLAVRPGERILDLGCGDGVLTAKLVAAGAEVVGVDTDASMLAAARARGLDVRALDGQRLGYQAEFDAVFSNAALHWMPDHEAVLAGVFRALKPGGRFVGECGGHGNIAAIRTALRAVALMRGEREDDQQNYPTAEAHARRLEAAGFGGVETRIVPRPTPLPTGMRGWLQTFRAGFMLHAADRAAAVEQVEALLAPALRDDEGRWTADYVRLRWRAIKPKG